MTDWLVVVNQSYNCFRVFFPLFFSFLFPPPLPGGGGGGTDSEVG